MIKRTIIIFFVLLIMYSFLVEAFNPNWNTAQHQWQSNIIKAQRYLYEDSECMQNVIIGTSLSNRLSMDHLPIMYNMTFDGLYIYDGLYVLTKKKVLPKKVFIEMNYVYSSENKEFIASIGSPAIIYARGVCPMLRDQYQPIGLICNIVSEKMTRHIINQFNKFIPVTGASAAGLGEDLFNKMLSHQLLNYSKVPDAEMLSYCFGNLKRYVAILEKGGVNVTFFEMPVNEQLCNMPKAKVARENFFKYFPPNKYQYIDIPNCSEYKTADGVHLTSEEALRYTDYFRDKIIDMKILAFTNTVN